MSRNNCYLSVSLSGIISAIVRSGDFHWSYIVAGGECFNNKGDNGDLFSEVYHIRHISHYGRINKKKKREKSWLRFLMN